MKTQRRFCSWTACVLAAAFTAVAPDLRGAGQEEGVALGLVCDTSASMGEQVPDEKGGKSPKYVIAMHALDSIVNRLQASLDKPGTKTPLKIHAGLIVFRTHAAATAIPLGPFKPNADRITSYFL